MGSIFLVQSVPSDAAASQIFIGSPFKEIDVCIDFFRKKLSSTFPIGSQAKDLLSLPCVQVDYGQNRQIKLINKHQSPLPANLTLTTNTCRHDHDIGQCRYEFTLFPAGPRVSAAASVSA
jgi:hypothetical protein